MSEQNTEVLDFLRVQFARNDEQHEKTRLEIKELKERIGRVETALVGLHHGVADTFGSSISNGHRLDALVVRIDRIERRLDLVDHP